MQTDYLRAGHPALELALRWLERNRPSAGMHRILHGDLRIGNLIVAEDGLAAILDWECAHVGDPALDAFGVVGASVGAGA